MKKRIAGNQDKNFFEKDMPPILYNFVVKYPDKAPAFAGAFFVRTHTAGKNGNTKKKHNRRQK